MTETDPTSDVAALTVELLSAYLANNTVPSSELAELIRSTRAALTEDATPIAESEEPEPVTPAVSVRKSLASPAHIISLIDGKPYKTLKRHLASHGLTPDTYRSRYNLPASYPMVAPDYAAHRRAVAQKIGLGSRKSAPSASETVGMPAPDELTQDKSAAASEPEAPKAPLKRVARGNGKKPARTSGNDKSDPIQDDASALATEAGETAPTAIEESSSPTGRGKSRATRGAKDRSDTSAKSATPKTRGKSAAAPATTEATAADSTVTPKRRGRIGLFKTSERDGTSGTGGNAEPNKSSTPKKSKRMARTPDSDITSKGGPEDIKGNQE